MSLPNFDAWLEAPYADRAQHDDEYRTWCEDRDLEPNDEAERAYDNWLGEQEWIDKYGEDPTGYGEPFTGDEVDPHPFGGEAA